MRRGHSQQLHFARHFEDNFQSRECENKQQDRLCSCAWSCFYASTTSLIFTYARRVMTFASTAEAWKSSIHLIAFSSEDSEDWMRHQAAAMAHSTPSLCNNGGKKACQFGWEGEVSPVNLFRRDASRPSGIRRPFHCASAKSTGVRYRLAQRTSLNGKSNGTTTLAHRWASFNFHPTSSNRSFSFLLIKFQLLFLIASSRWQCSALAYADKYHVVLLMKGLKKEGQNHLIIWGIRWLLPSSYTPPRSMFSRLN